MTSQVSSRTKPAATRWYALPPEDVAGQLGVDAVGGLSAAQAAERLEQNGAQRAPRRVLLIAAVVSFPGIPNPRSRNFG